jgi:hypothetical protein
MSEEDDGFSELHDRIHPASGRLLKATPILIPSSSLERAERDWYEQMLRDREGEKESYKWKVNLPKQVREYLRRFMKFQNETLERSMKEIDSDVDVKILSDLLEQDPNKRIDEFDDYLNNGEKL